MINAFAEFIAQCWTGESQRDSSVTATDAATERRSGSRGPGRYPSALFLSLHEACEYYCSKELQHFHSIDALASPLQRALSYNDTEAVRQLCMDVFQLGGISRNVDNRCYEWVERTSRNGSIAAGVLSAVALLQPGNDTSLRRFDDTDLTFSRGMAKVYAIADVCGQLIAYDGRVGSGLGLLVGRFLARKNINHVPPELVFPRGEFEPRWSPSVVKCDQFLVGHIRSEESKNQRTMDKIIDAAVSARRACTVVALARQRLGKLGVNVDSRSFERALFMIGREGFSFEVRLNFEE